VDLQGFAFYFSLIKNEKLEKESDNQTRKYEIFKFISAAITSYHFGNKNEFKHYLLLVSNLDPNFLIATEHPKFEDFLNFTKEI
jgi:hypothetical protein